MKIGLLTPYFADYGSFYQASALYHQLEKMGHEVTLINESVRYRKSPKLIISSFAQRVLPLPFQIELGRKVTAFNTYRLLKRDLTTLRLSPATTRPEKRYSGLDCVIVGSDEQWSVTNPNILFIPDCFGVGVPCPMISYATSGINLEGARVPADVRSAMVEGLWGFKAIAVRDRPTARWVGEWTGRKDIQVVLDPTLLNPFFVQRQPTQSMATVYGEHFTQAQQDAIVHFAREHGWKLLAIAWNHPWCDEYLQISEAADVQRAFAAASYCMSSTFHGTIFAILAHRPFACFGSALRGRKVQELLSLLGLEDRFCDDGVIPEAAIDFEAVEILLNSKRQESLAYLESALALCRKEGI